MRDRAPPGFAAYYAAVLEAEAARTVDASRPADPDGNADSRQRGGAAMEQMKEAG